MNDMSVPVQSLKTLMISMVSAVLLAFFILIAFIGPAEYAIDPTGIGKALGLTALAKPVTQSTKAIVACPVGEQLAQWQNIVKITIPAHSGLEYKLYADKNAALSYAWASDSADLFVDFHGEPAGNTTGYFKSYGEQTVAQAAGDLIAPFAGTHGWYWKNDSNHAVQVTLKTKGQYKIKGLM
ncbi:MAG: hypothetical protein GQ582_04045 [Methyloprofundus sp.]|nr:hypothetical protein [Methyloprofundus sp.]